MQNFVWKSRLARRIIKISILLVALPLIVAVIVLGRIGREQIILTANTMQQINEMSVKEASASFQFLGRHAVYESSSKAAKTSIQAIKAQSGEIGRIQAGSLAATAQGFSRVTRESLDKAMHQSLVTNRGTLRKVSKSVENLFTHSARDTQLGAVGSAGRAIRDLIDKMMEERAGRLSSMVNQHINDHLNYLALTAQMPDLYGGSAESQKAVLDALVRRFPMLTLVSVLDDKGHETAMSASDHAVTRANLGNHPDEVYFRTAMRGERFVGMEEKPHGDSAPVLVIAVPIEIYQGKQAGVLAARLSLIDLWDTMRSTRIGQHGFAYVLDKSGRPLLPPHPNTGHLLTRSADVDILSWRVVVAQPREEAMQPIHSLESEINHDSQWVLHEMRRDVRNSADIASRQLQQDSLKIRSGLTHTVQSNSQTVIQRLEKTTRSRTDVELGAIQSAIRAQAQQTQIESDRAMAEMADQSSSRLTKRIIPLTANALKRADNRLSTSAIIILLLSCAVGCLLALLLASRIVHPVVRLLQGTRAIAQGDLEKRVDERAPDEIGDLALAFNSMAASLKTSRAELNEAEAQLVQSAKLASLGTLSAGVAHELNQPVAIIRGITQQIELDPNIPNDLRADLELIEGQTSRMMKIIKHLRTFSRVSGTEFTLVNINQVIDDCFILIRAQLTAHDIDIELNLSSEPLTVTGDANELEQVFLNLITNARDALEGRKGACLSIRSWAEAERCMIEFHDNGPGIPQKIISHVFDPFFTTKEPGKGTGLGLSITHSIIQKHHGNIQVHSEQGAAFVITLPAAPVGEADFPSESMSEAA